MDRPLKMRPAYAATSVDNALRAATMLQLEGPKTVTEVAQRLGVSPSTAHRLLTTLVYRDFAAQDFDRTYRAGPVLEMAAHSQSAVSRLRVAALPHLRQLVDLLEETANVIVRTGTTARFIASVESPRTLRVGSREGMVFPAHQTTGGLLLLSQLTNAELDALYSADRFVGEERDLPDRAALRRELARVSRNGFAVNQGRSERGLVAVGVPVHDPDARLVAGLAVSMPSARYDRGRLPQLVATLQKSAAAMERDLGRSRSPSRRQAVPS